MAGGIWLNLYENASEAALAAREAKTSHGAAERCAAAAQVRGGPVCACPICKTKRACDRAIAKFDMFRLHQANEDELAVIRERMLKDLPRVTLENGIERREEILRPPASKDPDGPEFREKWDNADEFQRYLAQVLPEIDHRIDGDPPGASADWVDTARRARDFLAPLTGAPEVTKGAAGMSRRSYAVEALRLLEEIDRLSAMMARTPADDGEDPDAAGYPYGDADDGKELEHEQRWLLECFAEIAVRAFNAGVLARAAAEKAIEADALRGAKVHGGAKMSAENRLGHTGAATKPTIDFMAKAISEGATISAAARMAVRNGLGRTAEANRKLWTRHRPK